MCNIEFPHFGASYPDAHCINGYLYDMDSYEDGVYTIGGDDPCPFCNTEEWLKDVRRYYMVDRRGERPAKRQLKKSRMWQRDSPQIWDSLMRN